MQIEKAKILIEEADKLLETASHELERSEEDVIASLVCYNARQSIINYLSSYLMSNDVEIQTPVTMAGLQTQCSDLDARFELIDMSEINCNHDPSNEAYCTNVSKVSDCLKTAQYTQGIVKAASPAY